MLPSISMVGEQRFEEGSCFCYRSSASCCWREMVAVIICSSCLGPPGIKTSKTWSKINGRKVQVPESLQAGRQVTAVVRVCCRCTKGGKTCKRLLRSGTSAVRWGGRDSVQESGRSNLLRRLETFPLASPLTLLVESQQGRLQIATT